MDSPGTSRIGELLRHWRSLRSMSQADLAQRAGLSARHLSWIETGKAHPSRESISWIAQALTLPAIEIDAFFEAAGYLPGRAERHGDETLAARHDEVRAVLAGLAPHPALAHDVAGRLIAVNDALRQFLEPLVGALDRFIGPMRGGHDLLVAVSAHIPQAATMAELFLQRLHAALLRGHGPPDPELEHLLDELSNAMPDHEPLDRRRDLPTSLAVELVRGERRLAFDAVTVTLGTPSLVGVRSVRVLMFLARPQS